MEQFTGFLILLTSPSSWVRHVSDASQDTVMKTYLWSGYLLCGLTPEKTLFGHMKKENAFAEMGTLNLQFKSG